MGKFEGFLDDVIVNAKAAADVVSRKATDVYDASKLRIAAAEIRSEINAKLRELGAMTYKSVIQGADMTEKINKKAQEIVELREQLNALSNNIASSKNKKYCPECGVEVSSDSVFCNICGEKIENSFDA
jgi:uncharacterized protein YydD (DUF2326 family)